MVLARLLDRIKCRPKVIHDEVSKDTGISLHVSGFTSPMKLGLKILRKNLFTHRNFAYGLIGLVFRSAIKSVSGWLDIVKRVSRFQRPHEFRFLRSGTFSF